MRLLNKIFSTPKIILILIIVLAGFFRFSGINWDSNHHLHPDERFLTMVAGAVSLPKNFYDYLNPYKSGLNPVNVGYRFFVYGIFPLTFNKILAIVYNNDNYNAFTLQGRLLSGLFDILTLILVYKTLELLEKKDKISSGVKYWASFLYAVSVLPIQFSHFFTVDVFLNFFMFANFYFALKFFIDRKLKNIILSAIFFGLALASKVSAIYILPLILFFILPIRKLPINKFFRSGKFVKSLLQFIMSLILFFLISYITLRLADPYMFETGSLFDFRISKIFIDNLKILKSFEGKDIWYPPAVQWINKQPIIFSLKNLAFFGVGLPYFVLIIIGLYKIFKTFFNDLRRLTFDAKSLILPALAFWVILFFLYQSTQFVKAMRYFIFIYPFLAIIAGLGINYLNHLNFRFDLKFVIWILNFMFIIILLIWPLAFSSIYLNKHSRVEASEWIYQNLEDGSLILTEYWDDALPLPLEATYGKKFNVVYLPVFDPDTPEKWQKMDDFLQKADYYVLSSNRGWGSIPTVPEKYPKMSRFYKDLFEGRLNYKLIKTFTSYPELCYMLHVTCYTINDDWSDESFTVYDHPKVLIYKKI